MTVQEDVFANAKQVDPDITVLASVTDRLEDYDLNKMQDHVAAVYKGFDMSKLPASMRKYRWYGHTTMEKDVYSYAQSAMARTRYAVRI